MQSFEALQKRIEINTYKKKQTDCKTLADTANFSPTFLLSEQQYGEVFHNLEGQKCLADSNFDYQKDFGKLEERNTPFLKKEQGVKEHLFGKL